MPKLKALGISVKYDDRDTQRPGFKFAEYELKGVPVRLAIGGRDMENKTVELARRDTREKQTVSQDGATLTYPRRQRPRGPLSRAGGAGVAGARAALAGVATAGSIG